MVTFYGILGSLLLALGCFGACVLFCRGWRWVVIKGQKGL